MNPAFLYENIELWQAEKWSDRKSKLSPLVQWIGENQIIRDIGFVVPEGDPKALPYYKHKNASVETPEVVEYWKNRGVRYSSYGMGGGWWIAMVPEKAMLTPEKKLPVLLVAHKDHYDDCYWAMRTMEYYKEYNELVANGDIIILYTVSDDKPDAIAKFEGILQEGVTIFPADVTKVYLDISTVKETGTSLKDIPNFTYLNKDGTPVSDPDAAVEYIGNIPVLDISNRWQSATSALRGVVNPTPATAFVDPEKLVHSLYGQSMMEGIIQEYKYANANDPELIKYWDDMGAKYEAHDYKSIRWYSFGPKTAYTNPEEKLPLVVIMYECDYANDHHAVTCFAAYREFCKISAQGDCMILFFAQEDFDSNDALVGILEEAFETYPIDKSRVYITGHSHNGIYSREFAARHPELFAAIAPCGVGAGLPAPKNKLAVFEMPEHQVEMFSKIDMPILIMSAMYEMNRPAISEYNRNNISDEDWVASIQRRMKAFRCHIPTREEIDAAITSPDKATRVLGIPNDKNEIVYINGVDHYVLDFKNTEGRYHFRLVAIDGLPHMVLPSMSYMVWSFLKRFKRDLETGEIIELS